MDRRKFLRNAAGLLVPAALDLALPQHKLLLPSPAEAMGVTAQALLGKSSTPTNRSLLDILTDLGLTSNLQLCLDAGDSSSYSSGQTWSDRSGNAYNFFRGTTSGSEASDPTFNGSAGGLSSSEYWSFDGGDEFTATAANPTWVTNLHKASAAYTILFWVYLGNSNPASSGLFATSRVNTGDTGIVIRFGSTTGQLVLQVFNGSGTVNSGNSGAALATASAWSLVGLSMDTSDASTGRRLMIMDQIVTGSGTYTSPSSGNASFTAHLGVHGDGTTSPLVSGSRMGDVMAWNRALTDDEKLSVLNTTRPRYDA